MTHRLRLVWRDGRVEEVPATAEDSVLDAAEATGADLPFGCRTGACGTCAGRLLAGEIEYQRPPRALKPEHREDGYVLTCVAEPRSDCRIRVGADVASGLHENPWK